MNHEQQALVALFGNDLYGKALEKAVYVGNQILGVTYPFNSAPAAELIIAAALGILNEKLDQITHQPEECKQ